MHYPYVAQLKTSVEIVRKDADKRLILRGDRAPPEQHVERHNAPTSDSDMAVVIANLQTANKKRDTRDGNLSHVSEMHRSYDALQYPLLFWYGSNGYHCTLKHSALDRRRI